MVCDNNTCVHYNEVVDKNGDLKNVSCVVSSDPTKLKAPIKLLSKEWLINPTISSACTQGK